MDILWNIVILLVGFFALIKGADIFVEGSASVARMLKVPSVIIGLTIVAMGTSAPELAVSVSAGLSGSNAIAVSNVIGSNLFNLLVVLGVCAMMKPLPIETGLQKRDFPVSFLAVILMIGLAGNFIFTGKCPDIQNMDAAAGVLLRWKGILLLALFLVYLFIMIRMAKKNPVQEITEDAYPAWKSILYIVVGLAAIIIGGNLVVNGAKSLAHQFGMSETLIGLTIVAIGTSLPELVTSIVASLKGENGMAVGNVVGSNIFNLLLILGVSSTLHPITVSIASFVDLGLLLAVSLIAYGFACSGKKISRIEGAVMVAMYVLYTSYAIMR